MSRAKRKPTCAAPMNTQLVDEWDRRELRHLIDAPPPDVPLGDPGEEEAATALERWRDRVVQLCKAVLK